MISCILIVPKSLFNHNLLSSNHVASDKADEIESCTAFDLLAVAAAEAFTAKDTACLINDLNQRFAIDIINDKVAVCDVSEMLDGNGLFDAIRSEEQAEA